MKNLKDFFKRNVEILEDRLYIYEKKNKIMEVKRKKRNIVDFFLKKGEKIREMNIRGIFYCINM